MPMDVPQQIIDGSFYIPLRGIGDSIGADISWDSDNKIAHIAYKGKSVYVNCGDNSDGASTEIEDIPFGNVVGLPDFSEYVGLTPKRTYNSKSSSSESTIYSYQYDVYVLDMDKVESYILNLRNMGYEYTEEYKLSNISGVDIPMYNASKQILISFIVYDGGAKDGIYEVNVVKFDI